MPREKYINPRRFFTGKPPTNKEFAKLKRLLRLMREQEESEKKTKRKRARAVKPTP